MFTRKGLNILYHSARTMSTSTTQLARSFAPLGSEAGHGGGAPGLKGIVFDVDGTLWYV